MLCWNVWHDVRPGARRVGLVASWHTLHAVVPSAASATHVWAGAAITPASCGASWHALQDGAVSGGVAPPSPAPWQPVQASAFARYAAPCSAAGYDTACGIAPAALWQFAAAQEGAVMPPFSVPEADCGVLWQYRHWFVFAT